MSDDRQLIAPRADTPKPRAHDGRASTTQLPDDLVSDQVQRLALFSAIAAALWTNGLVMDTILIPLAIPGTIVSPISTLGLAGMWGKGDPRLDVLPDDSRFQDLLRRLGLG